jgi:hypothetical protein
LNWNGTLISDATGLLSFFARSLFASCACAMPAVAIVAQGISVMTKMSFIASSNFNDGW